MSYAPIRSEPTFDAQTAISQTPTFTNSTSKIQNQRRRKTLSSKRAPKTRLDFPLIVHSHLCWDWVWQRPQQFLSRLSAKHRVLFVETVAPERSLAAATATFRSPEGYPNLTILRLQFPTWQWQDGACVDAERRRIVQQFVSDGPQAGQFERPVQWFYDPMAVKAFAGHMGEVLTVYDCMDELSQFRFAPPEIHRRETELLARADVVFTGGRKLFQSKSRFNDNCHFFGCGVDVAHFGCARDAHTQIPPEVASLTKPVLGYFGVVDERLDYELIAKLADANPGWSVVVIGPVIKVDAATLPQRPNISWLGQRPYETLPAFCKGFDVCLMPFALNEATEFINPTKALEYMATGRPIVSTAVPDVVSNFGSIVKIAKGADQFTEFCRQQVNAPDHPAIARGLDMAKENSWDTIVEQLENHVLEALLQKDLLGVAV